MRDLLLAVLNFSDSVQIRYWDITFDPCFALIFFHTNDKTVLCQCQRYRLFTFDSGANPRLNAGLLPLLTRLETRKTQLFSLDGQVYLYYYTMYQLIQFLFLCFILNLSGRARGVRFSSPI